MPNLRFGGIQTPRLISKISRTPHDLFQIVVVRFFLIILGNFVSLFKTVMKKKP